MNNNVGIVQVRPTEIGFNLPLTELESSNPIELKFVELKDALDDDPAVKDDAQCDNSTHLSCDVKYSWQFFADRPA